MTRPSPQLLALALLPMLAVGGCGYQQANFSDSTPNSPNAQNHGYQWKSLYREDVQTVAVPVFNNVTYRRGLELQLTKAIVQDIEARTPYKVVSDQTADTILEGEITYASNYPLSISPWTNLPQEQQYIITINFTWKNLRTGQILVDRKAFDQRSSYYPTLGESPEVGAMESIQRLALSVVDEMQADW